MSEAAALVAWLGGSVILLADGRRGLALGLALISVALAGLVWLAGQPYGAAALLAGGAGAASIRVRRGQDGWRLMEPGSTPLIILTLVTGLFALWIATSVSTGDGASLRFAVLAVLALMGARVLNGADRTVMQSAAAGLALVLGAAAGISAADPGPAPYVLAAAVASGVSALSFAGPHGN